MLVSNEKTDNDTKIKYEEIGHYLKKISLIDDWFESIIIEQITLNNITASFKYKYGQRGYIIASSKDFRFKSSLYFESEFLNMNIDEFLDHKRKITLNGTLYLNQSELKLYSNLNININDDLDANILINTDANKLTYKLKANKNIKNITHLINIAHLPKEARYWALDAIEMSDASLDNATGYIDFKNIKDAYKNIKIKATLNKLNYAYDTTLDSIHTQKTILEFKNGILFIYPKEAYTYGMYLDKSWLKIDFTQKDEILTLHLLFDGKLNKDLLKVLNRYKIKLPFLQRKGTVTTNLKLVVNLMTIDVNVNGDFFTKKGNFDYLGLNIDIFDTYIKLNNYDVLINNMKAKYKDIATSNVDVRFDAKHSQGTIFFKPELINLGGATLLQDKNPINIIYNISPDNDTISIEKSKWKYNDMIVNVEKTTMPFDLDKLLVKLPTTFVAVENIGSGFVSGVIPVDTMKMKLRADILKFDYAGVKLSQSNTPFNISYNDKLHISSHSNILFSMNNYEFDISNINADIDTNSLHLNNANFLSTDGLLAMQVNAFYNTKNNTGIISLNNLKIENKNQLLYTKDKALFSFTMIKNNIKINSRDLGLEFNTTDSGWDAKIDSLNKIYRDSNILKKFKLQKGKISFYKKSNEESVRFNAIIKYPYKLLIEDNIPVENYKIKGIFSSKKSFLKINDKVKIKISDKIKININDSIINTPALISIFNDINISSNSKNSKSIILDALNSSLDLGNNRHILSDEIHLQHDNDITTAQLEHQKGFAGFKLDNEKMHLYGENFGDKFMEKLFSLSKFKGGNLNFSMNGNITDYDGLFYITDTIIVDYKMLNNILAFVNTVPSLATFSLPGYSKSGLKVTSAYMNFNAKNSVFNISDFFLDSQEIDILGSGIANIPKDEIDVTLNLKTDLGSSISKIPLVGYIILGEDTVSTTMSITGKLSDPDVKSLIAQDILVAPINIVKRALLLPYDLLQTKKDINSSK